VPSASRPRPRSSNVDRCTCLRLRQSSVVAPRPTVHEHDAHLGALRAELARPAALGIDADFISARIAPDGIVFSRWRGPISRVVRGLVKPDQLDSDRLDLELRNGPKPPATIVATVNVAALAIAEAVPVPEPVVVK